MTTQHTSTPWWRDDDGFIAAGSGDSYVTIADFDCSPDLSIDEREANKALAIAAPAMRAAMPTDEFFDLVRAGLRPDAGIVFRRVGEVADACRAAIADVPTSSAPDTTTTAVTAGGAVIHLSRQDIGTILAALRVYQTAGMGKPSVRSDYVHELATCGGEEISHDDGGIDDLFERINGAEASVPSEPGMAAIMRDALETIDKAGPTRSPSEDYDDTEEAYSAGLKAGAYDAAIIARKALAKAKSLEG